MHMFSQYHAVEKLNELAQHPIDLTQQGSLTPERINKFSTSSCGYKFLYATERVTGHVMQSLTDLARESNALNQMKQMQEGEVVNLIHGFPSENRPALHTATRDFFENPHSSEMAKEASELSLNEINKLKKFLQKIDSAKKFTDLIMIGIGGSDLGPRAHFIALQHLKKPGVNVHFISNIDPDEAALVLRSVNLKNTLIVVVSKTGTTLETLTNEAIVRKKLEEAKLDPSKHIVTISMPGSPLDNPKKYLECFHIWDWIGGRFSTTSMVGGVLLAFALGFDHYWEFLRGANCMDKTALNMDVKLNLPLLGALLGIWNRNFLHYPTLAIIPYTQALSRYPAHIQQLDMESHGKRIDIHGNTVDFETGPVIWGEPGTNAQHSFFQLLHQGTDVVPIEFIGYQESQTGEDLSFEGTTSQEKLLANLFAQNLALALGQKNENPNKVFPGNRPSHILLGKKLTPHALGALLSYFEGKIAFQGFIWNINSFDQEGVQLGKVTANKIIARMANKSSEPYPLGDALISFINK